MKRILFGCVALAVAVLTMTEAKAVSLTTGSSIPLPSEAEPVGATLLTTASVPFIAPTFNGTLISSVWTGDTANTLGGLTFTYQLFNNSGSQDPIDRFTLSSYAGFQTDASYTGAGIIPTSVVRNPSGNQISFNFTGLFEGTLTQGANSVLLIVQTDSSSWQNSIAGVINSSTANVATFAPLAVPEPAAGALLVLGALGLAFRRKP